MNKIPAFAEMTMTWQSKNNIENDNLQFKMNQFTISIYNLNY